MNKNVDYKTIAGFGEEWARFDQSELSADELCALFDSYFDVFPWCLLPPEAEGFDMGCGTGRWAKLVAPRVGRLHCIDPSDAIDVARRTLAGIDNCVFHRAAVDELPLQDESMDFGYSLGVLHHIPDTALGIAQCVEKLKMGAPFLVYLYYSFENRPLWFRLLWRCSDLIRTVVSRLPFMVRYWISQAIAVSVYLPLARLAYIAEKCGANVDGLPLSSYRRLSFYTMRTDALDRFGTRLEKRFSRRQIQEMMEAAGLGNVVFAERTAGKVGQTPFWCAVGVRVRIRVHGERV